MNSVETVPEVQRDIVRRRPSKFEQLVRILPFMLSHHPLCENYRSHVFSILGVKICRGCTATYLGMFLGLIYSASFVNFYDYGIILCTFVLLLLTIPSWVFVFWEPPFRIWKDFGRGMTGFSVGAAMIGLFSLVELWEKLYVLFWIIILYITFALLRIKQGATKECSECPQYHRMPYCDGMSFQFPSIKKEEN